MVSTQRQSRDGDTAAAYKDFPHTGPGTLAGRYMRLFWQPVAYAYEVPPGEAKPIRVMGEDFTLYRGEGGAPHVLAFRCAHRGTQLSVGWVEGDAIRCFYHGWKYDATGQCVEQPAEPEPFCQKVRIRGYPTEEYLGLIFAYLGEGEPPPLPRYPHFEEPYAQGLVEETEESWIRRCNFFQLLENSMDATHVGFVHSDHGAAFDGLADSPLVFPIETEWGIAVSVKRPSGQQRTYQFGMPNVYNLFALPYGEDPIGRLENLVWMVPIDDQTHRQIGIHRLPNDPELVRGYRERRALRAARRDLSHEELAEAVLAGKLRRQDVDKERTHIVAFQDDVAQVGQGRLVDRRHERLGQSDVAIILLRKIWARELRALGEGRPLKQWNRPATLQATIHGW